MRPFACSGLGAEGLENDTKLQGSHGIGQLRAGASICGPEAQEGPCYGRDTLHRVAGWDCRGRPGQVICVTDEERCHERENKNTRGR